MGMKDFQKPLKESSEADLPQYGESGGANDVESG